MIDTDRIRKIFSGHFKKHEGHGLGCQYTYVYCAVELLCKEVDALRLENNRLKQNSGEFMLENITLKLNVAELQDAIDDWAKVESKLKKAKSKIRAMKERIVRISQVLAVYANRDRWQSINDWSVNRCIFLADIDEDHDGGYLARSVLEEEE